MFDTNPDPEALKPQHISEHTPTSVDNTDRQKYLL